MEQNSIAEAQSFTANGVEYFISKKLSIGRFQEFEKLGIIHGFGKDFQSIFTDLTEVYDLLEHSKLASASVKVGNLLQGIIRTMNDDDKHPVLRLCALFINAKDENVKEYDEAVMNKKINDWTIEGFNFEDFFYLASSLVKGYSQACEKITEDFSKLEAKIRASKQRKEG